MLARSNRLFEVVLTHSFVLQIVDDHQAMWFDAATAAERRQIEARLRRQIRLALVNFVGFEIFVHGAVVTVLSDPLQGGLVILAGLLLMHATGGGR